RVPGSGRTRPSGTTPSALSSRTGDHPEQREERQHRHRASRHCAPCRHGLTAPPLCPAGNASTMSSPRKLTSTTWREWPKPHQPPVPPVSATGPTLAPPRRGSCPGSRSLARDESLDQSRKERLVHAVDAVLAIDDDSVLVNEEPHALPYRPPSTE